MKFLEFLKQTKKKLNIEKAESKSAIVRHYLKVRR